MICLKIQNLITYKQNFSLFSGILNMLLNSPFFKSSRSFLFFHYRRIAFSRLDLKMIYISQNNIFLKFFMFSLNDHVTPKLFLFLEKELACSYLQISYYLPIVKYPWSRVVNNQFRAKILLLKLTQKDFFALKLLRFQMLISSCKKVFWVGYQKIIDVNILALNTVYFPNYCLIIKTSISLKVRSTGFCEFAAIKKNKSIWDRQIVRRSLTVHSLHPSIESSRTKKVVFVFMFQSKVILWI